LKQLYKNYNFSVEAIGDITYWNLKNFPLYQRIHELLMDIEENPFQGGIGKTEVLKNQKGIVSKRINDEHRMTYQLDKDVVHIIACKGHYD
jgi:toxin YoeB